MKRSGGKMQGIGDTLRMMRVQRGFTPEQVAEVIGVSKQTVSKYEDDIWRPGTELMRKLADCFGVTMQEIINGYSLLCDDKNGEILVVRHMEGNRIRVIGRVAGSV
jgi:transcriptional regulator with XRE-family HTH domain